MHIPPLLKKFARYGITAGIAAVVDIGGFVLLTGAGVGIVVGATLSFLVAAVVNYVLTSRFVFNHASNAAGFGTFLAAAMLGLAVNVSVTYLAAAFLSVPLALAKVIGVGVAFVFNFTLNAAFVFRTKETAS